MAIRSNNNYFTDFEDNGLFSGGGSVVADMFADIVPELAPMTTAAVTAAPQSKSDIVDNLTKQILSQNTASQWTGQGKGSSEANAKDMAQILADTGITDINQFGQITKTVPATSYETEQGTQYVPEQTTTTYGNKLTGQEVANTYGERQQGNAFGGTYTGEGNTGYRVNFDANGNPSFYTTGASSSDVGNWMPVVQLALAATGAGGLLGNALLGAGANQVAASALGGALLGGGTSALAGQNILKGAVLGGAGGALSGYMSPTASTVAADADLAGGLIPEYGTNAAYDQFMGAAIAPSEAIATPVIEAPAAYYEPAVTPTPSAIDYSLSNSTVAAPETYMGGAQGFQPGVAANLEGMGGAQGLLINAGAPSTTLADAIATFGGVNPAYMAEMGGAQGLTYQTPTGLVTEAATLPIGIPNVLDQVLGETGINTATNIGSGIGNELAAINTGVPSLESVTPATPTAPANKSLLDSLTPSQAASLLKGALGLFGALSAGKAMGSGGGSNTFNVGALPTQGIPLNSQDYFNAIQQNYNTLLPAMPKDVATPLADWYNTKYTGA